jgi:hypothetical protein
MEKKQGHCCCMVTTSTHWRQEPLFVARKTITKPSIFVKCVIKFEGTANPNHILSLCSITIIGWVNCYAAHANLKDL